MTEKLHPTNYKIQLLIHATILEAKPLEYHLTHQGRVKHVSVN